MRGLIGWLLLLPLIFAFWLTMKIANACVQRGDSWRLLGILSSLVIGGSCAFVGWGLGPEQGFIIGWITLIGGGLIALLGTWTALVGTREENGISEIEKRIRNDPLDRSAWLLLSDLYFKEQRYKDLENALKMSLKADAAKLGRQYSITYMQLGKIYLAALSVSVRGKGIPILGYIPSNVNAETLGYSIEELCELAKENLSKAYEMDKKAGIEEFLEELDLALNAVSVLSVEAFEKFDRYQEEEREKEEEESGKDEWA